MNRRYLAQDPHFEANRWEANLVGARGCPYNCSFCGAAVSADPDITIGTRRPGNILDEMHMLRDEDVTAFRFVDDLFLGVRRVIEEMMGAFTADRVGDWAHWAKRVAARGWLVAVIVWPVTRLGRWAVGSGHGELAWPVQMTGVRVRCVVVSEAGPGVGWWCSHLRPVPSPVELVSGAGGGGLAGRAGRQDDGELA